MFRFTKKEMIIIGNTGKSFAQVTEALTMEFKSLNSSLEQLKRVSRYNQNKKSKSKFF